MSDADDELIRAAADISSHDRARAGFIGSMTMILGGFAVLYGLLTLVYGDDIWRFEGYQGNYTTALQLPGAPETWGVGFTVVGVWALVVGYLARSVMLSAAMALLAIMFGIFASSFVIDAIRLHAPESWPAALTYATVAVSMGTRARLAWVTR